MSIPGYYLIYTGYKKAIQQNIHAADGDTINYITCICCSYEYII